jgi:hypothetical protein
MKPSTLIKRLGILMCLCLSIAIALSTNSEAYVIQGLYSGNHHSFAGTQVAGLYVNASSFLVGDVGNNAYYMYGNLPATPFYTGIALDPSWTDTSGLTANKTLTWISFSSSNLVRIFLSNGSYSTKSFSLSYSPQGI